MEKEEWMCRCQNDWEGYDCSVKLETDCDDNKDNDGGKWPMSEKFVYTLLKDNILINEDFTSVSHCLFSYHSETKPLLIMYLLSYSTFTL